MDGSGNSGRKNRQDQDQVRTAKKGSPGGTNKRITVENCPLKVRLEPWLEGKKPSRKPGLEGAAFETADTKHGDRMAYEANVRSSKLSISIAQMMMKSITLLFIFCFSSHWPGRTAKPNVIFVLADDLGWAELACYGNSFNETPHLDKLAEQGIRFTHAYAAAPVCSPYRAALLTGQHPARVGILDYLRPNSSNALPVSQVTLPKLLKRNGYATGMVGKWHLTGYKYQDAQFEVRPTEHGFGWNLRERNQGRRQRSQFLALRLSHPTHPLARLSLKPHGQRRIPDRPFQPRGG